MNIIGNTINAMTYTLRSLKSYRDVCRYNNMKNESIVEALAWIVATVVVVWWVAIVIGLVLER